MKYIRSYKLFENDFEIEQEKSDFLNRYAKGKWEVDPSTGLININGGLDCQHKNIKNFKGIRFGKVTYFYCNNNQLTSLEGAPQEVKEDFDCSFNSITSLNGSPKKIGLHFNCSSNYIKSLIGAPEEVKGILNLRNNLINSLEGAFIDDEIITVGGTDFTNNPVSEETLEIIFNKMQKGISYPIALAYSRKQIPPKDWDLLDKIEYSKLSDSLKKGSSVLGSFDS